ncbi:MAG: hypothetical protein AB1715_08880, partial [Acidobacteriota bacterium]
MRFAKTCHIRRSIEILFPLVLTFIGFSVSAFAAQRQAASNLDIRLVTDEADAVLLILQKIKSGQPVADTDWKHLFSSEGYVRLKKREQSLKRPFEDEGFR